MNTRVSLRIMTEDVNVTVDTSEFVRALQDYITKSPKIAYSLYDGTKLKLSLETSAESVGSIESTNSTNSTDPTDSTDLTDVIEEPELEEVLV